MEPKTFVKLPKKMAEYTCPFCGLGTSEFPTNKWLGRKTKKFHLKTCKKATIGATSRQMYTAQLKRDGAAGNIIRNTSRIKIARNKAIEAAKDRNHTPVIINGKKKYQTKNGGVMICGSCLTTSFNCKWKQECPGMFKGVGRDPPSTPFWKF